MKAAIVMGSKSDLETVKPAVEVLKRFGVGFCVRVLSAHRTPAEVHDFVTFAEKDGVGVFIAAAGKAAHLAGVVASFTVRPVIGLPILSSATAGLDSLLSMVQMPAGIPVAVVALNGAENAGFLAVQILSLSDEKLKAGLRKHRKEMADKVLADDKEVGKLFE